MFIAKFFSDLLQVNSRNHNARLLEVIMICVIAITVIQIIKFVKENKKPDNKK